MNWGKEIVRLCDQNKRLKDALRHIAEYPNITAAAMRDCARQTLRRESGGEKGSEPKPGCSHTGEAHGPDSETRTTEPK
jgi:hypothetical protein